MKPKGACSRVSRPHRTAGPVIRDGTSTVTEDSEVSSRAPHTVSQDYGARCE